MEFGLSEEQQLVVGTTRAFVENELYPHEAEVERTGVLCGDGCLVPAPSQHAQPEERAPAESQFPRP